MGEDGGRLDRTSRSRNNPQVRQFTTAHTSGVLTCPLLSTISPSLPRPSPPRDPFSPACAPLERPLVQCPLIPSSCWRPIEWRCASRRCCTRVHIAARPTVLRETEGTHISERDAPWTLGLARKISLSTRACLRIFFFFFSFLSLVRECLAVYVWAREVFLD